MDSPYNYRTYVVGNASPPVSTGGKAVADRTALSLADAAELVKERAVSPVELTQACLHRIEQLNPDLNAFITVTAQQALDQAQHAEKEIRDGRWRGPLHGIPLALKDNIDTADIPTTAGSKVYADRVPAQDAAVVAKLKQAGAVLLGKLNMHEFAYGTTSVISYYGAVRNPWHLDRISGGSSGGSAAAVAAGLCYGALGTDTGGSVRLPAACCGIVGMKPSYGLVSLRGIVPLAWSFDHVGPLCRTAGDAALMLAAIAGYDPLDPASVNTVIPAYPTVPAPPPCQARVGLLRDFAGSEALARIVAEAGEVLAAQGASVQEVQLPELPAAARSVMAAEVYAFHAAILERAGNSYDPRTRERILSGAQMSTAEYINARRDLDIARRRVHSVFEQVDILLAPTIPGAAPPITASQAPVSLATTYTFPFNALGLPAISVPCGVTQDGLPLGLQIVGPYLGDATVLAMALHYERAAEWRSRRYPV